MILNQDSGFCFLGQGRHPVKKISKSEGSRFGDTRNCHFSKKKTEKKSHKSKKSLKSKKKS